MKKQNTAPSAKVAIALGLSSAFTALGHAQNLVSLYRGSPNPLIEPVEQIGHLDQSDMFGKNNADFYAVITVKGRTTTTRVDSHDDAHPYWQIPRDTSSSYSDVTIRVMDGDGDLERRDDHGDLSPMSHQKDIRCLFNRSTGNNTGDVQGQLNERFVTVGNGDDDRVRLTFTVIKD